MTYLGADMALLKIMTLSTSRTSGARHRTTFRAARGSWPVVVLHVSSGTVATGLRSRSRTETLTLLRMNVVALPILLIVRIMVVMGSSIVALIARSGTVLILVNPPSRLHVLKANVRARLT